MGLRCGVEPRVPGRWGYSAGPRPELCSDRSPGMLATLPPAGDVYNPDCEVEATQVARAWPAAVSVSPCCPASGHSKGRPLESWPCGSHAISGHLLSTTNSLPVATATSRNPSAQTLAQRGHGYRGRGRPHSPQLTAPCFREPASSFPYLSTHQHWPVLLWHCVAL